MAPISPVPQNSRAGLITSVVVFVILFVTATICAIYYGTQWQAEVAKSDAAIKALSDTVKAADVAQPEVQAISQDAKKLGTTGIQLALDQRNKVAKISPAMPPSPWPISRTTRMQPLTASTRSSPAPRSPPRSAKKICCPISRRWRRRS